MPAMAARSASRSESWPSVAEICVSESVWNSTGSAPVWSTSARSWASWTVKLPSICARPPPIPSLSVESV